MNNRAHEGGIDLAEAKLLKAGDWLYSCSSANSSGLPRRVRVTSVKTWKTRPLQVEVRVKYGLNQYYTLNEAHLWDWTRDEKLAQRAVQQK